MWMISLIGINGLLWKEYSTPIGVLSNNIILATYSIPIDVLSTDIKRIILDIYPH